LAQLGEIVHIPKGTFKDGMSQEFSFSGSLPAGSAATSSAQNPVRIALSLYESEDAFKNGKNPTVRFDNDGLLQNGKLLLRE